MMDVARGTVLVEELDSLHDETELPNKHPVPKAVGFIETCV